MGIKDDIRALLEAEMQGVKLVDDPVGFIIAVVIDWILRGLLNFFAEIGAIIWGVFLLLVGVLVDVGSTLLDPFGEIGTTILAPVRLFNMEMTTIAGNAGPLGPIVVVLIWAAVVFILAWLVRSGLEVVQWI